MPWSTLYVEPRDLRIGMAASIDPHSNSTMALEENIKLDAMTLGSLSAVSIFDPLRRGLENKCRYKHI
jgi:hypothetical protein